jgi:hypothetical protein
MYKIYGSVSRINFNVIDYVYDWVGSLMLSSKCRSKFKFKIKF